MIIKPLGASNTCNTTSSSNYNNANLVRITHINLSNGAHTVSCYANTTLKYSIVVIGGESVILEKSPTDTINSTSTDTSIRIVPVAYKN
tara:strand:+ start:429 stop:695 length:267 start_codon:yes stop_codon:yes gene_type:complete